MNKIKNYAIFGLFSDGKFIESGSMQELMDAAETYAKNNPMAMYSISDMAFKEDSMGMAEIDEGSKILNYFFLNNDLYIVKDVDY